VGVVGLVAIILFTTRTSKAEVEPTPSAAPSFVPTSTYSPSVAPSSFFPTGHPDEKGVPEDISLGDCIEPNDSENGNVVVIVGDNNIIPENDEDAIIGSDNVQPNDPENGIIDEDPNNNLL
jgi:hypothetical protein